MTRKNLFIKQVDEAEARANHKKNAKGKASLLHHTIGTHWWLAVICGIVYFFASPIVTLLFLNQMNFDYYNSQNYLPGELYQNNVEEVARWMSSSGMLGLYLAAVVLSMVLGCVMFSYLQHRRQVNFYHSQPIHRTRLFINQYGVGFVMNMILMVLMFAVSCLMIVMYGLGEALSIGACAQHLINIFVLSLASYSISVLAGQLTGTVLTHLALMLVIHFSVPLATVAVYYLGDVFFATFAAIFPEAALNFSPLCAMFTLVEGFYVRYASVMLVPTMGTAMTATLLAIGIGFAVLAWWLYQKRPSEATGKSLIYSVTEPFVKAYLMFVGALGFGFIFYAIGDQTFFYFAVLAFSLMIHMVCQVIIEHDFKALFHQMKQFAVITVLICAVIGVARFDVLGYDRYLPDPSKVSQVSFELRDLDSYYGEVGFSDDQLVKEQVHQLLEPVIDDKLYRTSRFAGFTTADYAETRNDERRYVTLNVSYELNNGSIKQRTYMDVPLSAIEENFTALYDMQAYRESYYEQLLEADFNDVAYMSAPDQTLYRPDTEALREQNIAVYAYAEAATETYDRPMPVDDEKYAPNIASIAGTLGLEQWPKEYSKEAADLAYALFTAYQMDLLDRDFSTLEEVIEVSLSVQIVIDGELWSNRGYSSRHLNMPVYTSDERTMSILKHYGLAQETRDYSHDKALVFYTDEINQKDISNALEQILAKSEEGFLSTDDVVQYVTDGNVGTLAAVIEGHSAVDQFIRDSKLRNSTNIFTENDEQYFVLLQYEHGINNNGGREWISDRFQQGTVPEAYLVK